MQKQEVIEIPLADAVDRAVAPAVKGVAGAARLQSLDAFRGLVILAMLVVNNLGDWGTTGYFWKHADFIAGSQAAAYGAWWAGLREAANPLSWGFTQFPLWHHCTLADYVMPSFMLIIGVAIPFSVAAAAARGTPGWLAWFRVIKRAIALVVLGWVLVWLRDDLADWWYASPRGLPHFSLGMDVLQLLGVGYLVARILYVLPAYPRLAAAVVLFLWHWGLLRFGYVGDGIPRGTLESVLDPATGHHVENSAVAYAYAHWPVWDRMTAHVGSMVTVGWRGLLSVPPAAATMVLGSLIGDWVRRGDVDERTKVRWLAAAGAAAALIGFLWAFDQPFNKPRWTPSYLVYVSGVGAIVIAIFYTLIDVRQVRDWTQPLLVFGANSIAAYFLSIAAKVVFLNTPRVHTDYAPALEWVKYGTLAVCSAVMLVVAYRFFQWVRHYLGQVAYAVFVVTLLVLCVIWVRFLGTPVVPTTAPAAVTVRLVDGALAALKTYLGSWEGGWLFTGTFVAFWWIVLDWMYRKRIFWKL